MILLYLFRLYYPALYYASVHAAEFGEVCYRSRIWSSERPLARDRNLGMALFFFFFYSNFIACAWRYRTLCSTTRYRDIIHVSFLLLRLFPFSPPERWHLYSAHKLVLVGKVSLETKQIRVSLHDFMFHDTKHDTDFLPSSGHRSPATPLFLSNFEFLSSTCGQNKVMRCSSHHPRVMVLA